MLHQRNRSSRAQSSKSSAAVRVDHPAPANRSPPLDQAPQLGLLRAHLSGWTDYLRNWTSKGQFGSQGTNFGDHRPSRHSAFRAALLCHTWLWAPVGGSSRVVGPVNTCDGGWVGGGRNCSLGLKSAIPPLQHELDLASVTMFRHLVIPDPPPSPPRGHWKTPLREAIAIGE